MGDTNPTPPGNAGDSNANAGGGGQQITFTSEQQAVIDRIVGERAKRGGEAAINTLLESLGVKSVDELKTGFADALKLRDAQKSELQKAQDAVTAAQAKIADAEKKAADALAKSRERSLRASVIAEAQKQNFDESEFASVWNALKLDSALMEKIKDTNADDFEGVADAVKEIAKAHPRWLKSVTPAPHTNINATNAGRQGNVSVDDLVKRKRAQYGAL
jgi:hypothetical protein